MVDGDPAINLRLERKEESKPPCPAVENERQSGRNLAFMRVRLVDEDVWIPEPPCPAGGKERQLEEELASTRVPLVDEEVWVLEPPWSVVDKERQLEENLASMQVEHTRSCCGATALVIKWVGTKGGAFGLRGRLNVRISMPPIVEGTVEAASDARVMDGSVITVELALEGE